MKMDFSKFLLVTDLDGTFFAKGARLVQRNLDAVARFQAGGGLFAIASGRLHLNLRGAIAEPEKLCNAPAILSNGAYLYDFTENRAFSEDFLPEADARALMDFAKREFPEVPCRVSTPYSMRTEALRGELVRDATTFDEDSVEVKPLSLWRYDDWYKLVFRAEPQSIAAVRARFEECFGERFDAFCSGLSFFEVQKKGINKALGIKKLQALCGGERTVIACGDFENDLEMLRAADIAVCPENAQDALKADSDFVFCHCDDGLIADVVEAIESGKIQAKEGGNT